MTKRKYAVFGQLVEHYLKRSMRFIKVYPAIKFTALAYLAGYIKNNTERRYANRDDVTKKNFYKLMNNSPYGKTIENVEKRSNIKLLTSLEKMRKMAEQPHCIDLRVFADNLFGIEMRKNKSLINKPFQMCFVSINFEIFISQFPVNSIDYMLLPPPQTFITSLSIFV